MEHSNHTDGPLVEEGEEEALILPRWYVYIMIGLYVDSLLTIPGNLMTIIAFFKYRLRQATTNMLICNQSIADLLFALIVHPLILMNYYAPGIRLAMRNKTACLLSLTAIMFSLMSSVCSVALLTLERFISLVMPIKSRASNKVRVALAFIIPSWVILLVVNAVPLMGFNVWTPGKQCFTKFVSPVFYSYVIFQPMLFALLIIAVLNFGIWRIATKRVSRTQVAPQSNDITPTALLTAKQQIISQKLTRMQLTVVGCFYAMYMPFIVLSLIVSFPPVKSWTIHGPPETMSILLDVTKVFVGLNSALNPVIYAFRSPHFNKAFRSMVCRSTPFQQSS